MLADRVEGIAYNYRIDLTEYVDSNGVPYYGWCGAIPEIFWPTTALVGDFTCPSDNINQVDYKWLSNPNPVNLLNICPVDTGTNNSQSTLVVILGANWGSNFDEDFGYTNYVSMNGADYHTHIVEKTKWKGCMSYRGRVTLESIQDGTSRTIMFAENIGAVWDSQRGYTHFGFAGGVFVPAFSWYWGGCVEGNGFFAYEQGRIDDDAYGVTPDFNEATLTMIGDSRYSPLTGIGAAHPAGANVALADGSTHNLNRNIYWETLYQMCGARDGEQPDFGS